MHFALPPRKTSHPPPYARAAAKSSASNLRRRQIRTLGYVVLGALTLYLILTFFFSLSTTQDSDQIEDDVDIVIVTVFDHETMSNDYIKMIRANRDDYAARHGTLVRHLQ